IDEPRPASANPASAMPIQANPNVLVPLSPPCQSNLNPALSNPPNCNSEVAAAPGAGPGYIPPYATQANVFVAQQVDASHIVWLGVPIDPPGSTGLLVL